jgi:predicted  nucleic acid-binding Zn-ribbon protein
MDGHFDPRADDTAALSDGDLEQLLEQLDEEERRISRRRASLHSRIDYLHGGGSGFGPDVMEEMQALTADERRISDERQALHRRIDVLRDELRRRRRAA